MEYKYDSQTINPRNASCQHRNDNASVHSAMPFPTVNCQLSTVNWIHTFSAKEKDTETGYSYFGSRYYSSDLSIWLSVDPMAAKYPSLSPYVYCANNPIKLVDPNGEKVFAYDKISKRYMKQYLKEQFGSIRMFRFTAFDELKIRPRQFKKAMERARSDQKILLQGMQNVISNEKGTIRVQVKENSTIFDFDSFDEYGPYRKLKGVEDGATVPTEFGYFAVAINHNGANSISMTTDATRKIGKDDEVSGKTGKDASAVFMHEVLDEGLNYFIEGNISDSSPQKEKVYYQNAALRNKSLPERNGKDHE
jgi:RHS repeat-associated protein